MRKSKTEEDKSIQLASRLGTLTVTVKGGAIDSVDWEKTIYPGEMDFEFDLGCLLQVILFEPEAWNKFLQSLKSEMARQGARIPHIV